MSKQTLTFLGRDSGFGEENTSAYVDFGNKFLLIDCGYTIFNKMKSQFEKLSKYDSFEIVVTHLHPDHAGSLGHLISCLFFHYDTRTTVISKCKHIREYLDITGTPREAYDLVDHLDDLNLEMIETIHTDCLDAYGFNATINGRKIVYTGDTSTLDPYLPYLKDADEFYVDSSITGGAHLKIDEIQDKLKELKANGTDVYLIHLQNKEKIREITNGEFFMD